MCCLIIFPVSEFKLIAFFVERKEHLVLSSLHFSYLERVRVDPLCAPEIDRRETRDCSGQTGEQVDDCNNRIPWRPTDRCRSFCPPYSSQLGLRGPSRCPSLWRRRQGTQEWESEELKFYLSVERRGGFFRSHPFSSPSVDRRPTPSLPLSPSLRSSPPHPVQNKTAQADLTQQAALAVSQQSVAYAVAILGENLYQRALLPEGAGGRPALPLTVAGAAAAAASAVLVGGGGPGASLGLVVGAVGALGTLVVSVKRVRDVKGDQFVSRISRF